MTDCLICGRKTIKPFADFVWHFRPIDWPQRHFVKGNFRTFGFWSGLKANITLMFPFLNTLLNWKYRKSHLEIGGDRAVAPAEVPKCLGYPKCDGTLPGEPHEPECPVFKSEAPHVKQR